MRYFFDRLKQVIHEKTLGKSSVFAKKAGIPYSTFHAYLSERFPIAEHLIRIRDTFGVSIDWLLTGEGKPYIEPFPAADGVASIPPEISDLLERAKNVLTSGIPGAFDALQRNIDYFSHSVELERKFVRLEDRIAAMEEALAKCDPRAAPPDKPGESVAEGGRPSKSEDESAM